THSAEMPPSTSGRAGTKQLHAAAPAPLGSHLPAPQLMPGKPPIRLPTDSNVVVLRMDRSVDAFIGPGMVLEVYADGRVVAEVPDGLFSLAPTDLTKHAKDLVIAEDPDGNPERQRSK